MMAVTHSSVSIMFNLIVLSLFNFSLNPFHFIAMIIFSWLPDIDTPNSLVGRAFSFVSKRLNILFGHRGFLHSLTFVLLLSTLFFPVFILADKSVYIYFLILPVSYFSHLIADCFNISGVRLMYPSNAVFVFPKNESFRFRSGDMRLELPVIFVSLVFSVVFFISVMGNDGFISFLRIKFAKPSMAEQQFVSFEHSKYYADITLYDKISRQNIDFTNVEVLFSDSNKVIFFQGDEIKKYENSDLFNIVRVSLKKSNEQFDKTQFTGNLDDLLEENFRAFTGTVNGENMFFSTREELVIIQNKIKNDNKIISDEIASLLLQGSAYKVAQIRRNILTLENERDNAIGLLNNTVDIKTKLELSDRIKRITSRIESLNLDLSLVDTSIDQVINSRVGELRLKIIERVECSVVLIK